MQLVKLTRDVDGYCVGGMRGVIDSRVAEISAFIGNGDTLDHQFYRRLGDLALVNPIRKWFLFGSGEERRRAVNRRVRAQLARQCERITSHKRHIRVACDVC